MGIFMNLGDVMGGVDIQNLAPSHAGITHKNSDFAGIRNAISHKIHIN
jgi:hypothetical protein